MLARLKALLAGPSAGAAAPAGAERVCLATAALLVEAASMDGDVGAREHDRIIALLSERFRLTPQEAAELWDDGFDANRNATQLLPFTRSLKDALSYEERVDVIGMLWEVAYADGRLHDHEANLIRRISGLIYVSDQDSGAARKQALARLGLSD